MQPLENSIEFGYPYDGKGKKSLYFSACSPAASDKFDINFSLHGGLLQPAKAGTTLKEICDHYNIESDIFTYFYDREKVFSGTLRILQRYGPNWACAPLSIP